MRFRGLQKLLAIREESAKASEASNGSANSLLTSSQQRLVSLGAVGLGGSGLHLEDTFSILGPLDVDALERALAALCMRHAVLRSTFTIAAGVASQTPSTAADFRIERLELTSEQAVPEVGEPLAVEWARALIHRSFDLANEAPWRVGLIRFDDERHWLVLVVHHIAHDRWSRDLIRRELGLLYARYVSPSHAPTRQLAALPVALTDVARWQRDLLASPTGRSLADWWARALDGVSTAGGLRRTAEGPAARTRARVQRQLSPARTRELRQLANRLDVGLFVPLLAAHALLLREQGSGDDFMICTPMAGREDGRVHGLVGYLANIVPVRVSLAGLDSGVAALTERVRATVEDAYVHQDLPIQKLACLADPRLRPRSLFALQNTPNFPLRLLDCETQTLELAGGQTDFESFLEITPDGPGLRLDLTHDSSVISADAAEAALERYEAWISAIITDQLPDDSPAIERGSGAPAKPPRPIGVGATAPVSSLASLARVDRERQIGARFSALLDGAELEASLQALGVGSLALLQLLAAIEREYGVSLPLSRDLTTVPLRDLAGRTLDHVELDTMLRRPNELSGRGSDVMVL
ncbi:Linear gramicidin synthase subunit D [Enhygromyxa salina]|uniref:Linear gramicidin synthase subunit D n=2 Tax=Enhygromyxa salina TaxID=215803 RepID=A0A2S9YN20_9BACT|nr:condensation domain-containing protein [Enhygromyxa salina]PRQ06482.1 Linear gramicidin synthase subunit D [Enhygromyxa salina]